MIGGYQVIFCNFCGEEESFRELTAAEAFYFESNAGRKPTNKLDDEDETVSAYSPSAPTEIYSPSPSAATALSNAWQQLPSCRYQRQEEGVRRREEGEINSGTEQNPPQPSTRPELEVLEELLTLRRQIQAVLAEVYRLHSKLQRQPERQ
jgi:hypothetical protein